jgi:hypothetical protein
MEAVQATLCERFHQDVIRPQDLQPLPNRLQASDRLLVNADRRNGS